MYRLVVALVVVLGISVSLGADQPPVRLKSEQFFQVVPSAIKCFVEEGLDENLLFLGLGNQALKGVDSMKRAFLCTGKKLNVVGDDGRLIVDKVLGYYPISYGRDDLTKLVKDCNSSFNDKNSLDLIYNICTCVLTKFPVPFSWY